MESAAAQANEILADPSTRYGLHVRLGYNTDETDCTDNAYSASAAVIARFPYLHLLGKPDFLCKLTIPLITWPSTNLLLPGNTTDIAIWSTIEQGLAITASSLATLRPLIKQIAFRLNLTSKPLSLGPSGYGSSPRTPGPGTPRAFGSREAYTLSSVSRQDGHEKKASAFDSRQPSDLKLGIKKETKWEVKITKTAMSESEEELHSPRAWRNNNI